MLLTTTLFFNFASSATTTTPTTTTRKIPCKASNKKKCKGGKCYKLLDSLTECPKPGLTTGYGVVPPICNCIPNSEEADRLKKEEDQAQRIRDELEKDFCKEFEIRLVPRSMRRTCYWSPGKEVGVNGVARRMDREWRFIGDDGSDVLLSSVKNIKPFWEERDANSCCQAIIAERRQKHKKRSKTFYGTL